MQAEHETLPIIKSYLREKGFPNLPLMNLEGTILSIFSAIHCKSWGPQFDLNDPNSIDDLEKHLRLLGWLKTVQTSPIHSTVSEVVFETAHVVPLTNTD